MKLGYSTNDIFQKLGGFIPYSCVYGLLQNEEYEIKISDPSSNQAVSVTNYRFPKRNGFYLNEALNSAFQVFMPNLNGWISLPRVAKEAQVNPTTLSIILNKGQLRAQRSPLRKSWYIEPNSADEFILSKKNSLAKVCSEINITRQTLFYWDEKSRGSLLQVAFNGNRYVSDDFFDKLRHLNSRNLLKYSLLFDEDYWNQFYEGLELESDNDELDDGSDDLLLPSEFIRQSDFLRGLAGGEQDEESTN